MAHDVVVPIIIRKGDTGHEELSFEHEAAAEIKVGASSIAQPLVTQLVNAHALKVRFQHRLGREHNTRLDTD